MTILIVLYSAVFLAMALAVLLLVFLSIIMLMYTIVPGRVRVAVRLRPRNTEEMVADADFANWVELQPEVHFGHLFVNSAF